MKHIILICAAGMSTSLLVNKMKAAAAEEGKDVHIEAMSANIFATYREPVDVLLLGPQISFLEEEMRTNYEPKGIKVAVINMADYGMMDGKKVLASAYQMMGE
ncbi:PTS sugar transporter subunit IIB [Lachnospiraceae bacterium 47-T17]